MGRQPNIGSRATNIATSKAASVSLGKNLKSQSSTPSGISMVQPKVGIHPGSQAGFKYSKSAYISPNQGDYGNPRQQRARQASNMKMNIKNSFPGSARSTPYANMHKCVNDIRDIRCSESSIAILKARMK